MTNQDTESTVTTTKDTSPLTQAGSTSSLFNTPEAKAPAETAKPDVTVQDEAQVAKSAASSHSLSNVRVNSRASSRPRVGPGS